MSFLNVDVLCVRHSNSKPVRSQTRTHSSRRFFIYRCDKAISWGVPPPESQIPSEKHPKYKKTLKNASNSPPDMCSPKNLESRINTVFSGKSATVPLISKTQPWSWDKGKTCCGPLVRALVARNEYATYVEWGMVRHTIAPVNVGLLIHNLSHHKPTPTILGCLQWRIKSVSGTDQEIMIQTRSQFTTWAHTYLGLF